MSNETWSSAMMPPKRTDTSCTPRMGMGRPKYKRSKIEDMIRVRHKLILLGALVVLAVSSGFTWLSLGLAQRAIEEDLKARAIVYAREVAATLGDRKSGV